MSFQVDNIDLSLLSPETGEYLTANVYYVDGVDDATGQPRPLSIGQLVMAICLQRASTIERDIVNMMEMMNKTSRQLEIMTEIENKVLASSSSSPYSLSGNTTTYDGKTYKYQDFLKTVMGIGDAPASASPSSSDFLTKLEAKMDEKNSFSQQKMIELQSLTNKRDQSYDMISNILKSLGTVMTGIVNNT